MKMYFCPKCGQEYEKLECIEDDVSIRCPQCVSPRVLIRGSVLIGAGATIAMLATQLIPPFVLVAGILISGGLCMTGLVRALRLRHAKHRNNDLDDDSYIDYDDDYE